MYGIHISAETSAIIVFTIWGTAETGDLVRGAIESIPKSQIESAIALALDKKQIGIVEVLKVGQQIIDTNRFQYPNGAIWIYGVIFLLYFLSCWPLSILAKFLEKRWSKI